MSNKRKSGILLHPTSLPSPFGIGDMGANAFRFVDTLVKSGQRLWQILPLCPVDCGGSPYQSSSAFAGEPLLISPELLVDEGMLSMEDIMPFLGEPMPRTDYPRAMEIKTPLFKKAFSTFQSMPRPDEYNAFIDENSFWLADYALFSAAKEYLTEIRKNNDEGIETFIKSASSMLERKKAEEYFYSAHWCSFPPSLRQRTPSAIKKWSLLLKEKIEWEYFLQYYFHKQWQALKKYANDNNIEIIGDMPIFLAHDSADVWTGQKGFFLNSKGFPTVVSGVPPDYFSETGQLWGNPLYRWKAHENDGFSWWLMRVKKALKAVDILRLDHFRGFEAYWEIPAAAEDATVGRWVKGPGIRLFEKIRRELGTLPIIAEDLGIITPEVEKLRGEAGLPGMRVLQFAFGSDKNNAYLPHCYDKNTVVYTGTHDNNTTIGWYNNATETERDHFRRYMNIDGKSPSWDMLRLALSSPADTAVILWQDVLSLGEDYRMNMPGTTKGNWTFAFRWDMVTEGALEGLKYLSSLFGRNEY